MKRIVVSTIVATIVATALGTIGLAGSAGASGTDVCSLVTRKEASKILGAKVVTTKHTTPSSNPAQQCVYQTRKFTSKQLKRYHAPLELKILWSPLTQQLRDEITHSPSKFVAIQGIGDKAYFVDRFDVLAISKQQVVQASVFNWETSPSVLEKKSEQAVRLAVPRLPTG